MACNILAAMRQSAAHGATMICVTHETGFAREPADEI
jgi:ABC-type polar amino acid transport system ATPase subunit